MIEKATKDNIADKEHILALTDIFINDKNNPIYREVERILAEEFDLRTDDVCFMDNITNCFHQGMTYFYRKKELI